MARLSPRVFARDTISLVLGNVTLTLFALGLVASAISLLRAPRTSTAPVVAEALLS